MSSPRSFAAALVRAWRSLRRTPGFFTIGVLSLAIALGLATTVIAQIDALMHPYVALNKPEELFRVELQGATRTQPAVGEIAGLLRTSAAVAGVSSAVLYGRGWVDAGSHAGTTAAMAAPRGFFDLVGAQTRLGRLFDSSETTQSGVAVVSDAFWRRHYNNRGTLDGATLTYDGVVYRVVGVLAPHTSIVDWSGDVWLPRADVASTQLEVTIVRLKTGVRRADAAESLRSIADELERRHTAVRRRPSLGMFALAPDPLGIGEFQRALLGAAAFILLIACANVSALMLARAVAKRRDYALRLALGASRLDLVRDVAAEVVVLASIGGVAGLMIAQWTMQIMVANTPAELSWFGFLQPMWNVRVFLGMFGAVGVAVALAAVVPAVHVTRIAPADPLKDGSGGLTGRTGRRFQMLVVGELALAMVLLFGASLITKTANRVAEFQFGYEPRGLTRVTVSATVVGDASEIARRDSTQLGDAPPLHLAQVDGIAERVRSLPGVVNAAWSMDFSLVDGVIQSDAASMRDSVLFLPRSLAVGPEFFATLGVPVLQGRDFVAGDREGRGAIILDELSARKLFPDGNAVGGLVRLGRARLLDAPWLPVVGVVRHIKLRLPAYPEMEPEPVVFATRAAMVGYGVSIVVRPERGTSDIAPAAVRTVREQVSPQTPVSSATWMRTYESMLQGRRFVAGMFVTLSVASLVLATAGLFGVLSYAARQRNREFAVRIALGAQRLHVMQLVFRDGLVMALGGTAIGAAIGMWAGFVVYMWLWGVYPVDVGALVTAEAILLTVTLAATAVPAVHATRANPVDVMRAT